MTARAPASAASTTWPRLPSGHQHLLVDRVVLGDQDAAGPSGAAESDRRPRRSGGLLARPAPHGSLAQTADGLEPRPAGPA